MSHNHEQEFGTPGEALLAHHGVKGMKWGHTKFEALKGRLPFGPKDEAKAAAYNKRADEIVKQSGVNTESGKKYGAESKKRLSTKQKAGIGAGVGIGAGAAGAGAATAGASAAAGLGTILAGAAVVAGGGALAYGAHKYHFSLPPEERKLLFKMAGNARSVEQSVGGTHISFAKDAKIVKSEQQMLKQMTQTVKAAVKSAEGNDPLLGLQSNWSKGIDLPDGTVIKRLSTLAETKAHPSGFFGSHLESDVKSYKAILPTTWAVNGIGSPKTGGFVNHYKARGAIKAPSGEETFGIFKKLIHEDDTFAAHFHRPGETSSDFIRSLSDQDLKHAMVATSQTWADPENAYTKHFFGAVKSRGYNAVLDIGDAGKLSKQPIRVLDGSMFDVVKTERVGLDDFYDAAKDWTPDLVHAMGGYFLMHQRKVA